MSNAPLRCLQVNLRHGESASDNLHSLLIDLDIDVALVQEPFAKNTTSGPVLQHIPPEFISHHCLNRDHAFGAAIITRKSLRAQSAGDYSKNHMACAKMKRGEQVLHFFSIYARPSQQLENAIAPLLDMSQYVLDNAVLCIDSNAHHQLWNSRYSDARGEVMISSAERLQLNICNKSPTQSDRPLNTSFIDITLCGDRVQVNNWRYLDYDSLSDHPMIYFEITDTATSVTKGRSRPAILWNHIRQEDFRCALETRLSDKFWVSSTRTHDDLNAKTEKLTRTIASTARENSIPAGQLTKHPKLDWWTTELYDLRLLLRAARRRASNTSSAADKIAYSKAKRVYQREIRIAKKAKFRNLCSTELNKDIFGQDFEQRHQKCFRYCLADRNCQVITRQRLSSLHCQNNLQFPYGSSCVHNIERHQAVSQRHPGLPTRGCAVAIPLEYPA